MLIVAASVKAPPNPMIVWYVTFLLIVNITVTSIYIYIYIDIITVLVEL